MQYRPATWLVAILTTLALIAWCIPSQAQQCVTRPGWQYARSEEVLNMAGRFVQQGDRVAFGKLISRGLLIPLKAGVRVYLEPGGGFGHAAIRLPGELGHVWVLNEALDCQRR